MKYTARRLARTTRYMSFRGAFVGTALSFVWLAVGIGWAGDWPQFRGPYGNGKSNETHLPLEWTAEKNVRWKAALPRPGNGSPIVVAGRVLVACAEDAEGKKRGLFCFARDNGKRLWAQIVDYPKESPTHETNPYCGSTPASDGHRVVVWHASAGLHCYDLDGNLLWSRNLGEFEHMWGYGSSPILYQGRVILYGGPSKQRLFVGAYDLQTGQTLWETEEPFEGDGEYNTARHYMGSWTTPVIVRVGGEDQVVVALPTRLVAYHPQTGEILWWCDGIRGPRGDLAYSSPVFDERFLATTGGYQGPSLAVELGGRGDVTAQRRLWRKEQNPQSIGSGVLLEDAFYMAYAGPSTLQCIEVQTGKVLWTERGGANYWGSIVYGAGRCYVTDQNGTTLVFQPSKEKFIRLASNPLGEPCNATPALSDGEIFIRTAQHLYCISDKEISP
jgi:outer membrane protein assembly factor BamB